MARTSPGKNKQRYNPPQRANQPAAASYAPVLKTTQYDLVSAFMIAIVIATMILVGWVTAMWLANLRPKADNDVPIELVQLGGVDDGAPDETLKVESPEDPTDDPSHVDAPDIETQIEQTIETVIELSDNAAQQVQDQSATADTSTGKIGSKEGNGRRPLGSGPGEGGGAHLRWYIRFSDNGTLDTYGKQLDFFDIELGLLKGSTIELLSGFSKAKVSHKTLTGGGEKGDQLYFTWAGGGRKKADVALFKKKANIDATQGIIMHFYSTKTVQTLARLEKAKSKKPVSQIKTTYFIVRKKGTGYEFFIPKIIYR